MPKIPWFRDWFEEKFGDLCEVHDKEYLKLSYERKETEQKKIEADYRFAKEIAKRGHPILAVFALLFFELPWVGKS